jgi:hypothetical protein
MGGTNMSRILTITITALVLCAPISAWAANWKAVQIGVFVDMAHIRHIPTAADPTRPDTKVDIKRYGQMSEVYVRCRKTDIEPKDIPIVEFSPDSWTHATTIGVISMKALRAVVCDPEKM